MLGNEYFSRVYLDEFLAWYAQRAVRSCCCCYRLFINLTQPPSPECIWTMKGTAKAI